ncbi:hypothetical protein D3C81_1118580 [compost metagenome]
MAEWPGHVRRVHECECYARDDRAFGDDGIQQLCVSRGGCRNLAAHPAVACRSNTTLRPVHAHRCHRVAFEAKTDQASRCARQHTHDPALPRRAAGSGWNLDQGSVRNSLQRLCNLCWFADHELRPVRGHAGNDLGANYQGDTSASDGVRADHARAEPFRLQSLRTLSEAWGNRTGTHARASRYGPGGPLGNDFAGYRACLRRYRDAPDSDALLHSP